MHVPVHESKYVCMYVCIYACTHTDKHGFTFVRLLLQPPGIVLLANVIYLSPYLILLRTDFLTRTHVLACVI